MLGALAILGCLPMALIFGVIGIIKDQPKTTAIIATLVAIVICGFFFLGPLLRC